MATLARTLRPYLRSVRSQIRNYAEASGSDMKFTFAGANQVSFISLFCFLQIFNYFVQLVTVEFANFD